jgi:hypothetical protein
MPASRHAFPGSTPPKQPRRLSSHCRGGTDHRHHARADRGGQVNPRGHNYPQFGIDVIVDGFCIRMRARLRAMFCKSSVFKAFLLTLSQRVEGSSPSGALKVRDLQRFADLFASACGISCGSFGRRLPRERFSWSLEAWISSYLHHRPADSSSAGRLSAKWPDDGWSGRAVDADRSCQTSHWHQVEGPKNSLLETLTLRCRSTATAESHAMISRVSVGSSDAGTSPP